MQHFFEEQYTKEATARLRFYNDTKNGRTTRSAVEGRAALSGLPKINPLEFALHKKREEDEELRRIVEQARARQSTEEMRSLDAGGRASLYEGFSREGKGRYRYLRERHQLSPEAKFTFPMVSSWEYGWKIGEEMPAYGRPRHARTAIIKDSFYTRNGVPTLSSPDAPVRSYSFS
jgi:hypothetical protein